MQITDKPWLSSYPTGLPSSLEYPTITLAGMLQNLAYESPNRAAIIFYDGGLEKEISTTTYESLNQQSDSFASSLINLGINKGDKVAYFMENSPQLIIAFYGILKAGAVAVPCDSKYLREELIQRLANSEARAVVCDNDVASLVHEVIDATLVQIVITGDGVGGTISFRQMVDESGQEKVIPQIDFDQDLALLPYTGGTTGASKGAMLTHRNLVANAVQFARWYSYRNGEEVFISALPLTYMGGISGTMTVPISVGGTLILFRRFNPRGVLQAIQEYRATRFLGVPAMYIAVLNQEEASSYDLSSLTHSRTNAAPLPAAVKQAFDELVGHEVLIEGYGMTEMTNLIHANPHDRAKQGSIGIPLPDVEVRLVDPDDSTKEVLPGEVGELVLRGPQLMKGYWKIAPGTPEAIQNGWFSTGDLARMDQDGYFYIVDRIKDMINVSGFKVWPREVEEVFYQHPQVKQVAVFGAPDSSRGERVIAVVVPKTTLDASAAEQLRRDLIAFCLQRLTAYKVPSTVELQNAIPMSGAGKVLRRILRDQ